MNCPNCRFPAIAHTRRVTRRHSGRMVVIREMYWTCPGSCTGPGGVRPAEFVDNETLQTNNDAVEFAWRQSYGEGYPGGSTTSDMPRLTPPGTIVRPRQNDDPQGFALDGFVGMAW